MLIPHPIPYQGSKRHLAKFILPLFPHQIETLVEPFAGSAAISIAAACRGKASRFHLNDVNAPLMGLWDEIINKPKAVADGYERLWNEQQGRERQYYDSVRDEFNRSKNADCLLYLLARCVKASVRYNSFGQFNQSPDNRRKGRHPRDMRSDIYAVSKLFRGRTLTTSQDYRQVLKSVSSRDMIYMDPPYQGVGGDREKRYLGDVDFEELMCVLQNLIERKVPFILSYDGRTGQKTHGKILPRQLGLYRIEVNAGRSTQSTLLGGSDVTFESIYISKHLRDLLDIPPEQVISRSSQKEIQLALRLERS